MPYFYVIILVILVNIPFGYLRGNKKTYSFLWFLFIHLPVPIVMYIRKVFEVDLTWTFGPPYIAAYFSGQWLGKKFLIHRTKIKILTQPDSDFEENE